MNSIPIHKLEDKTSQGFLLAPYTEREIDYKQSEDLGAHRDDHYIFFVVLKGSGTTVVDFTEKTVRANQLYYILPDQIHHRIKTKNGSGWFIAVDPSLIEAECQYVFEGWLGFQEPITLTPGDVADYDKLLGIIYRRIAHPPKTGVNLTVVHSLLRSFFEMAASAVRVASDFEANHSRPAEISMKFKKLLNEHIRTHKSPSDYANMLHISEPYLNESLKKITGSSVSFWIKYKTVIEAKRLLYFSELTVKQIADELGFESHSYFSRFFGKETGMTALAFRKKCKAQNKGI
jgi:AraC-like DNA-binding protein